MKKVSVLGQNPDDLLDCSEVIPVPPPSNASTRYPAGFGPADVEHSVRAVRQYPVLALKAHGR